MDDGAVRDCPDRRRPGDDQPAYREHELEYALNQSGVRVLVAAQSFRSSDYVSMIESVRPSCPALERVFVIGTLEWHTLPYDGDPEVLATRQATLSPDDPTRGYSVILGYWDQPEKTAEAIDEARWMHTGDLATMDVDGYVHITGRIKDLVIRGARTSRHERSRSSCTPIRRSAMCR